MGAEGRGCSPRWRIGEVGLGLPGSSARRLSTHPGRFGLRDDVSPPSTRCVPLRTLVNRAGSGSPSHCRGLGATARLEPDCHLLSFDLWHPFQADSRRAATHRTGVGEFKSLVNMAPRFGIPPDRMIGSRRCS